MTELLGTIFYYLIMLVNVCISFVLISLLFVVTVPFDRNRELLHRFSRSWSTMIFWLNPLWHVRVEGKENIDRHKAYVIVVNHQSIIDIPLLYHVPFLSFKWVSKQEVYKIPLFGAVLWMHGDIAIERGKPSAWKKLIAKGADYLGRGVSIMIFPEGTRAKEGHVGHFKEGAFTLAKQANVDVLPVVSVGSGHFHKGWKLLKTNFVIRILPAVSTEGHDDMKVLAGEVGQQIADNFEQIESKR